MSNNSSDIDIECVSPSKRAPDGPCEPFDSLITQPVIMKQGGTVIPGCNSAVPDDGAMTVVPPEEFVAGTESSTSFSTFR